MDRAVGSGHVNITVDGGDINEQIVNSVGDATPGVAEEGDRAGDEYGHRFSDSFTERLRGYRDQFSDALEKKMAGGGKRAGGKFGDSVLSGLDDRVRSGDVDALGDALGKRIGKAVSKQLHKSFQDIQKEMEVSGNFGGGRGGGGRGGGTGSPSFPSQGPDPDRDQAVWNEALRMNEKFNRQRESLAAQAARMDAAFERQKTLMHQQAYRMDEDFDRKRMLMTEQAYRMNEVFERQKMRLAEQAYRMNETFDRKRMTTLEAAHRMNEKFNRDNMLMLERAYREDEKFMRQKMVMMEQAQRMNEKFDRDNGMMLDRAYRDNEKFDRQKMLLLEQAHRMNLRFDEERARAEERAAADLISRRRAQQDGIGNLFGRGSRNNALNLLGSTITNSLRAVDKLKDGIAGIFNVGKKIGSTFMEGFNSLEEGASGAQRAIAGLGAVGSKVFPALASSAAAAAVAIPVLLIILSALASVLTALLGIVTALAATIVSGLVGALLVAGGAVLALVAAGGLLTAAFMSMTDAQKSLLKDAFTPIKEEMVGIGQIILKDLVPAFATWSANLQQALLLLAPVAEVMGSAFAEAGNSLTAAFSGPGFQLMSQALSVYLPSIVQNLSIAFGQFLNGLMGLFAAVMPYVDQFAGYLAKVATEFANWASSADGQNQIADWVDRALVSFQSMWDFLSALGGLLARVLFSPEGQNAGNTIFDSMTNAFNKFTDSISSGDLENWFAQAIVFADALGQAMKGLAEVFLALDNSNVLDAVAGGLDMVGQIAGDLAPMFDPIINVLGYLLPKAIRASLAPMETLFNSMKTVVEGAKEVGSWVGAGNGGDWDKVASDWLHNLDSYTGGIAGDLMSGSGSGGGKINTAGITAGITAGANAGKNNTGSSGSSSTLMSLLNSGNSALNATSKKNGGYVPDYVNPYVKFAERLIKSGPSISSQIKNAMLSINKSVATAINNASDSLDVSSVKTSLENVSTSIRTSAEATVNTAQSALNTAAQALANATSASAAKKALKQVKKAQKNLLKAKDNQKLVTEAAKILAAQEKQSNAAALAAVGDEATAASVKRVGQVVNLTLADFAATRSKVADLLKDANTKLEAATTLRDNYIKTVSDSAKAYASVVVAQAKVINGVTQALTSADITQTLSERLGKLKTFYNNLRVLLAQGLSQEAYKQIVDAGVDQGGAYAQALIDGGVSAVNEVNGLMKQVTTVSDALGLEAGTSLYQSGVDIAQGLVDGLNSLASQLEKAAENLGDTIASAIAKKLGITLPSATATTVASVTSPPKPMGTNTSNQFPGWVTSASSIPSMSARVAVSPEVAAYSAMMGTPAAVSGNQLVGDITVITPTEDARAVAVETVNEIIGRIA